MTEGIVYDWRPYWDLYTVLVVGDGRRSLFGSDGLVAGTERPERWLLWPMGIPSPGAMRERGHHATAFVGRRHFDDPYLLEELFEPAVREGARQAVTTHDPGALIGHLDQVCKPWGGSVRLLPAQKRSYSAITCAPSNRIMPATSRLSSATMAVASEP